MSRRLGHGNKKKSVLNLYLTLNDDDLIKAIGMMKSNLGGTERWVNK